MSWNKVGTWYFDKILFACDCILIAKQKKKHVSTTGHEEELTVVVEQGMPDGEEIVSYSYS
jgi:hypothetical protein